MRISSFNLLNISMTVTRRALLAGLLIMLIWMPELLVYKLQFLIHIVYETLSFILEEILIHLFDIEKFYAQMIVFYLTLVASLLVIYLIGKKIPAACRAIRGRIASFLKHYTEKKRNDWQRSSFLQKCRLIGIQASGLMGGAMWLFV